MQPYNWGDWKSIAYDPKILERSKVLYEKYNAGLKSSDELALKIDQMKAVSSFTNDVEEKRRIQSEIDASLEEMASKDDYELRAGDISRLARKYQKEYTPLEENYKRYNDYVSKFNEEYSKGTYNARQAQLFSTYATNRFGTDYQGLKRDPVTGEIDQSSYFSGPTIYKDPKINDKIITALNTVKPINTTNQYVGGVYSFSNGQFNLEYDTPEGHKIEQVRLEDLKAASDLVLKDPEVSAYINQMADMEANAARVASGDSKNAVYQYVNMYNEKVSELQKNMNEATDEVSKNAYKKAIELYAGELGVIQEAIKQEDTSYQYLKNKAQQSLLEPINNYVESRSGIKSVEELKIEEGDLNDYAKAQKWLKENTGMKGKSQVITEPLKTSREMTSEIESKKEIIQNLYKELDSAPEERKKSLHKLIQKTNIDIQLLEGSVRSNILNNFDRKKLADSFGGAAIYQNIEKVWKKYNPDKDDYNMIIEFRNIFDNPQDQDYIDFKQKYEAEYGADNSPFIIKTKSTGQSRIGQELSSTRTDSSSPAIFEVNNYINSLFDAKGLEETKQSYNVYYDTLPGIDPIQIKAGTEAADKFFEGYEIPANIKIIDPTTPGVESFGKDFAGYKTSKWGFVEYGDRGAWELTLTSDVDGNLTKTVLLPAEQLSNETLDGYINSPGFKFAKLVDRMDTKIPGSTQSVTISTDADLSKKSTAGTFKIDVKSTNDGPMIKITNLATGKSTDYMDITNPVITGIGLNSNAKPLGEAIGELL